jgi:hypothetical protein
MKTKLGKQFKRPFDEAEDDWDKLPDFDPGWINQDLYIARTDDYYR